MAKANFGAPLLLVAALTLFAQAASAASAIDYRGKLLFLRCASCHDISTTSSSKTGPNLYGVYGRRVGSLPGFAYSPAMKSKDFTWNAKTLDRWLTKPTDVIPGTAMAFAGLPRKADRTAIIAYLRAAPK